MSQSIVLPWPPSILAGHAQGNGRWAKIKATKEHRTVAYELAVQSGALCQPEGDVRIQVHFYPPNNRGDRTNYPNRIKAHFDGIADALDINDKRFLPSYHFHAVSKKPCVVYIIEED